MDNNNSNTSLLSRAECNALRGLAIIGIFLHNYCHWLGPIVKENEYTFSQHNVDWLQQVLYSADALLPVHLISFFGHYGVPVFLFLSAYGLEQKYGREEKKIAPLNFVKYHYLKLFKMMVAGFIAFTMIDAITPGRFHYNVLEIVAQMFMFNNLLPNPDDVIWPGPYWYFGLMLQIYIVYRAFIYKRHWGFTLALIVICSAAQAFCAPESAELNWLRYNCVGGILPFGMGIFIARFCHVAHKKNVYLGMFLASTLLIYLCSMDYASWYIVPILICVASISLVKILPQTVNGWLEWMGGISAALFVCHPITRKIFIPISRHGDIYTGLLLYIIASVGVAWLFKQIISKIPNPKKIA